MTPDRILQLADSPTVLKMSFGSAELDAFNKKHRCSATGRCLESSDWYVVVHRNYDRNRPDFRVLSRWWWGESAPRSFDVPLIELA